MKKLLMFLAVAMLLFGLSGQASAFFEDGNLIRAVYQIGGQYEVLTDLGPFTQTTPYSGANLSFTSNPFPGAGSGAFSGATWAKLQVAYFIKTPSNAWISGPVDGQKIGSNHFDTYQSSADTVYLGALNYAAGTDTAQIKQTDLQSYVSIMDSGDPSIGAGFFAGFIPAGNGEQNLAALGSGSAYVDSYLYYYATPDSKSSGLQVADIRTFADGHTEIAPVAVIVTHTLTVTKTGTGNGTASGGGTYNSGTSHDITATAAAGSTFTGWSGDCTGTASPLTVLVDKDKTCTATFTLNQVTQFTLTVNTSGNGSGTVGGGGTYNSGTSHDITATAAAGSTFTGWSGDCTGTTSPLTVLVDRVKTCTATFTLNQATQFTLSVNTSGNGSGTVGGGGTYDSGTSHDITATAAAGSTFNGWSGDCTGTTSPLTVLVDNNKACIATFTLSQSPVISLATGWNLFGWVSDTGYYTGSAPAAGDYASGANFTQVAGIGDAMTAIGLTAGSYTVVIGPGGEVYSPGSSFNTLTNLLPGMAYWVVMNAGATITLPGGVLPAGATIAMPGGWIQAAYLGVDGAVPSDGFACITGAYDVIVNGAGDVYIPGSGSIFNTLSNVKQSEGYFIHATGAATLTYNCHQ